MRSFVIDTNVLYVANAQSHTSRACVAECARKLSEIMQSGLVVVDSSRLIRKEYESFGKKTGQPGAGSRFLRWLNQNGPRISTVDITAHDVRGFEEFPEHDCLKSFDPSDRKFVAVAAGHGAFPPILQAADSKWWGWSTALQECGINVEFLCSDEIKAKHLQRTGRR
jgi:hypothetical protein